MELVEVFSVLQDFFQKLLMASFFASFLASAHVLFEAIKSSGLLLALGVGLGSLVEVSVYELPSVHEVPKSLGTILVKRYLVAHVVLKDLLPQFLLKLVDI